MPCNLEVRIPTYKVRGAASLARADRPHVIHALESAAADIDTKRAVLIDQGTGHGRLRPNLERRGFAEALAWLPS